MPTEVFEKISKDGIPITRAKITGKDGVKWQTWRTPESTLAKYVDELQKDYSRLNDLHFEEKYNGGLLDVINEEHTYYVGGHNHIIKEWVPTKNRISLSSRKPAPLLQWAIDYSLAKPVKQLIQIGADISAVDPSRANEEIKKLLDNAEQIRSNYLKRHPDLPKLWYETWGTLDWKNTPDEELNKQVKALLDDGADSFIRSKQEGPTAVHFAANYGHVKTLQTLIEDGADIDTYAGSPHVSPLYLAAKNGHTEVVKKIFEAAPHNAKDRFYDYADALDTAVKHGHIETAHQLFELGNTDAKYAKNYKEEIDTLLTTTLLNHGQTKTVQKLAEWGRAKKLARLLKRKKAMLKTYRTKYPRIGGR